MATQYLKRDGGQIAYDEEGQGIPVICVPGMGDLRDEYRLVKPLLLDAGFRVVTMDLRGHGDSSAPWADYSVVGLGQDIVALIRRLNSGPAIVIGTSMGAGAAVCAAGEAPDLVAGMTLIGAFVRDTLTPTTALLFRLLFTVLLSPPWGRQMWGMYYQSLYKARKPADFADYQKRMAADLRKPGHLTALRQMMLASKAASERAIEAIKTPTLVIMGTKDPDFPDPVAEANWINGKLPGAVKLVEGAGHYPHVEMPEDVASAVIGFLQSHIQNLAPRPEPVTMER